MRWERFFDDLEDQLDSEWEAERAALDSEAERVRVSRLSLRERLVAMAAARATIAVRTGDEQSLSGRVGAVGADWLAVSDPERSVSIVPLATVVWIGLTEAEAVGSARDGHPGGALAQRAGLGYVLRDLARKRIPVTLRLRGGATLCGTVDRAGADHLDLAMHEPDAPRRRDNVTGFRLVRFDELAVVRPERWDAVV